MAADFLLVAALFRNPVPPQPETRVLRSFRPLGEVLLNGRFMLLLLIFAGFWFLYVMNFSFLTLYLDRFVPKPDWFDANLQQAIDPLFVVILGIPLGNVAAKRNPVRMMALGIALSVAGFLLLGFVPQFWALVAGIIVSTAGEVLAYPGFLAYVSRIAPKDRVAVYQGFGFLPIFAGFTLGPIVGGALYGSIAEGAGRPAFFWALMAAVPILSIVAFLLYARAQEPREARTRRGLAAPVLALLLVPLVALAGLAAGTAASLHSAAEPTGPLLLGDAVGTATEGQTVERTLSVPAGALGNVTLAFRWSDTTPSTPPGATNQPDTFQVTVLDALGERQTQKGSGGALGFAFPLRAGGGNLTVRLTLTDAGDVVLATPGGAVPVAPDTTADWSYTARLKPA
jgi:MFS family permease